MVPGSVTVRGEECDDMQHVPPPEPYLDVRETHCAGVVLVGDRAYKFKKPVDLGFLDFTTTERRAATCRREVELNKRFSPDVYLGVADLRLPDGDREPIVVMRRMPEERRLSTLVRRGDDVRDHLRRLARQLSSVHEASRHEPWIDVEAGLDHLRARWDASFAQVRPFGGNILDARLVGDTERLTTRFLDGRRPLFDQRIEAGCAVDGHGDLMADDVFCLDDGPRALDCLEFDDTLRYLDRIDDASFLAMDLERLGAPGLGAAFIGWYAEYSGDPAPPALVHHYIAYRAFMRAKIACLRHAQGADEASGARLLLECAHRHLTAGAVILTLVGGPPGSGKSTVAAGLADHLGMVVLSSDRIRKELAGLDPETPAGAELGQGIYDADHTARTYAEMLRRARVLLGLGESVVLDASWGSADQRGAARAVARATSADVRELCCAAPKEVVLDRVASRQRSPHLVSDADAAVAVALAQAHAPWPEASGLDTAGPLAPTLEAASDAVRPMSTGQLFRRPSMMEPD
jgi:aminoglycoside phosphotransferase family enzyme/predicted kinase